MTSLLARACQVVHEALHHQLNHEPVRSTLMTFTTWSCSIARSLITPLPGLDVLQAAESWCRCMLQKKNTSVKCDSISSYSVVSMLETCFLAATFVKVFKMSVRSCDEEWFVFDSKQTWLEFFHHPVDCSIQVLGFSSLLWPVLVAMRCAEWRGHHAEGFWFVGCNHRRFPEVSVLQGKGIALYDGISFMKKWWRHKIHIKWRSRPTTLSSVHISSSMDRIICTFTYMHIYLH